MNDAHDITSIGYVCIDPDGSIFWPSARKTYVKSMYQCFGPQFYLKKHGDFKVDCWAENLNKGWRCEPISLKASAAARAEARITHEQVAGLIDLIVDGSISGTIAKDVLALMMGAERGAQSRDIIDRHGLKQGFDTSDIEPAIDAIIAANPDKVAQVRAKPTMLDWFVGQVMKATGGKANPQTVNAVLKRKLGVEQAAPLWRHVVAGSVYEEVGRAELQVSVLGQDIKEGDTIVIYRGANGKLWARMEAEFEDGRFVRVAIEVAEGSSG